MTFAQLRTEFFARGFDYLNDGGAGLDRVKRWVNEAMHELCEEADWPFLELTTSGAAPLSITDLRKILSVYNSTKALPLQWVPRHHLVATYGDLQTAGTPRFYYIDANTVRVYPTATDTLAVRYVRVPADLSADSDTPLVPARYRNLIVDGAVCRALYDANQFEQAAAVEQHRQRQLAWMKRAELREAGDNPEVAIPEGGPRPGIPGITPEAIGGTPPAGEAR
jgi:hypothetical protein